MGEMRKQTPRGAQKTPDQLPKAHGLLEALILRPENLHKPQIPKYLFCSAFHLAQMQTSALIRHCNFPATPKTVNSLCLKQTSANRHQNMSFQPVSIFLTSDSTDLEWDRPYVNVPEA